MLLISEGTPPEITLVDGIDSIAVEGTKEEVSVGTARVEPSVAMISKTLVDLADTDTSSVEVALEDSTAVDATSVERVTVDVTTTDDISVDESSVADRIVEAGLVLGSRVASVEERSDVEMPVPVALRLTIVETGGSCDSVIKVTVPVTSETGPDMDDVGVVVFLPSQ